MQEPVNILLIIVSTITLVYSTYFTITSILGIIIKNKVLFKNSTNHNHFAIIIPARNEASVITNLLESLLNLNYPQKKYDIYVIPNNCTDDTKKIAQNKGAKIIECKEKTKTKGDVLNIAFRELKKHKEIDAYIIFDADNVVHPDFLKHMNDCLESGYRVAQGCRSAKNPSDNGMSGSYTLFYLLQNIFFNRSRMSLNGSASINGTGFMIKKEIIDEHGFETYSLTEDMEFTGICALRNERIVYVDKAITYDEYPIKFIQSWRQRRRWTSGTIECMKRYSFKLFKNFIKTGKIASLDMSMMYIATIFQILSFLMFVITFVFVKMQADVTIWNVIKYILESIVGLYITSIIVELLAIIYKKEKLKQVWKGLIYFPIFILTWLPINVVCYISKKTKWDVIKHSRNIKINEILSQK